MTVVPMHRPGKGPARPAPASGRAPGSGRPAAAPSAPRISLRKASDPAPSAEILPFRPKPLPVVPLKEPLPPAFVDFTRDQAGTVYLMLLALVGAVATMLLSIFLIASRTEPPDYFPIVLDSRLPERDRVMIEWPQTSEPMFNSGEVANWMMEGVRQSLTFDFYNYVDHLDRIYARYYTTRGQTAHKEFLSNSELLSAVRRFRQVIQTYVPGPPKLCASGTRAGGEYAWLFQIPLSIRTFQNEGQMSTTFAAEVQVVRRPIDQTAEALGIDRIQILPIDLTNFIACAGVQSLR